MAPFVADQHAVNVAKKVAAVATATSFPAEGILVSFFGEGETGSVFVFHYLGCALLLVGKWRRCAELVATNTDG